ncbi:guanosine-3',5'-bis(diphosphate) 3'-diphosphatase [Saccharobesus litoralis]|uniref:guanosine-3',5'-bis(diphosphate) 3'-diphosphatase n=1 Tax=Saccharobesus litoralis TaxID=2172099 RepID=A0A2S0VRH4_9ALTE|nr:bifunctional GTP diphosphokinase/guanosine-3',5'-bis pyrophosphate 3'-pyrophosphohydrolase [Saccharobesus litoralis]AWB66811.1 guanosine-3',5'-bis(diphosphate) 3'-diphosphatase [Saccharobesus litoralis]
MELFENLHAQVASYLAPELVEQIRQAYIVARDAHEGQYRSSGEPYITHPVAVTQILAEMHLDHETLSAALLHDVIEDTDLTKDDLAEQFGQTVADLVEGVSKLDKIHFRSKQEFQAENFRKMMMAMVQDIRVILIKLADRTHNMRTLEALRPAKRRRIARETLDIYAPIAHRLGIHDIKNELENLGFAAMHPMRHLALGNAVKKARGHRKEVIEKIRTEITERIKECGINCVIKGREKHLYSLYKKMKNKELMFNDVMDIYAFRIIVDDIDTCYRTLGVAHNLYKPVEARFKDYIAIPRINGYQSLHTSLIGPHGIPLEIQIRTHDMETIADMGVAAHWLYKQECDESDTTAQVRARRWMQSLVELQQNASSSFEFIDTVKSDLFPDEIYVFTPDGRIIELPKGATPVDFAYAVHTDVGHTCIGARVDRKPHPLNQKLKTGQTVEIKTSPGARPNANWLNFVITAKARLSIRNYLKNLKGEESVELGKRLLKVALGDMDLNMIPEERLNSVLEEAKLNTFHQLLAEIGLGNLMAMVVAQKLLGSGDDDDMDPTIHKVAIKGAKGLLVSFGKCCRPIPGDHIIAHVSPGKGLVVHQESCHNVKDHHDVPSKYIDVSWDNVPEEEFPVYLRIELINAQGALAKITAAIARLESDIISMNSEEKDSYLYNVELVTTVRDRVHLAQIIKKVRIIDEVRRVVRHKK